jgi:nicotinamidase-related amidase
MDRIALVVIDVQRGFDDGEFWSRRNNPACEANVAALIAAWRGARQPTVFVRHHWDEPGSPLRPGDSGSDFKDVVTGDPDLLVTKTVHSAFHGDPDLGAWLRGERVEKVLICGIQTNVCCETSARIGSDLGFGVSFALDATHTFDQDDHEGGTVTADELARVTRSNLDPEFCRVVTTTQAIDELEPAPAGRGS